MPFIIIDGGSLTYFRMVENSTMIQFDKPNKLTLRDLQGLSKPVTRFEENYSAARKKSQYLDQSQSRDRILQDLWDPIVEELSELYS